MRILLFLFTLFAANTWADEADFLRLANPPGVRMTCLPGAETVVFQPLRVGPVPAEPRRRKAFLAQAKAQNIAIGMEKSGPFDPDRGTLRTACTTGGHAVEAVFTYTNYPSRYQNGVALLAEGQCDTLTRLELSNLTVDGKPWGEVPDFLHDCFTPQVLQLKVNPGAGTMETCKTSWGGELGSPSIGKGESPAQKVTCETQEFSSKAP